jgi:predicted GIY-YIG superfamily endonuclease
MTPHFVYRCFDAHDRLLYIGCTSNVRKRIAEHRRGERAASRWLAVFMVRHEIAGPYPGRDAARAVEAEAINFNQPLFNLQHRANERQSASMTRGRVAEYLIDHGHLQLALETACQCWPEAREAGGYDTWCPAHVEQAALLAERGAA